MAQKVTPNVAIVARAFWDAAGSGNFFTRWTVVISFVVSTVLFVPIIGTSTSAYCTGFVVAVITWVMLALPVTGVAVAERRMSNRGARDRRDRDTAGHRTLAAVFSTTRCSIAFSARPAKDRSSRAWSPT